MDDNQEQKDMTAPKLITRGELRDRGWTHRQIKAQQADGVIKSGEKGRPKFGYAMSNVLTAERTRTTA